ncbi:MAG TPA: outer membrane protein assembly factor BamB [Ramlibacter sp.]|jgi:outer membrane assembly lipoprotein YfgL|uniref:outer membrane protein assembly factor BamB n=1 Tax=Ramlibacter sp. TaxID=1917967 RepID=UPI002D5BCA28|nr:outer membrane protein assembly factor BamB [Ramlibacter sp.]HZY18659.1 outer membrane protein assembly factor BamB [Ramlibacter sp.]
MRATPKQAVLRMAALLVLAAGLGGCSIMPSFLGGGPDKPKPAELQPNPALLGVRQAWTNRIGDIGFPLSVAVAGNQLAVAATDGTVAVIDATTGQDVWRASVGAPIAAGVGSDGDVVAVVTRANEVVALSSGKVLWREKLPAQAYTAPFVAGNRVFVLAADRSITAYDGRGGRKLWTQQRPGEPLVLRQAGVLLAVGDTLVAGQGGRLAGLNPLSGAVRWEAPIASPRGTNDVERLVDLVGPASRLGSSVCARAFQASVGCVDTTRGTLAWTKPANGGDGIGGSDRLLVGTETDGRLVAWRRDTGERAWTSDKLLHRDPGAPLLVGNSVVVGDGSGLVHVLSREDGNLLNRLSTDGSAIVSAPVVAGTTVVVVTRKGGIYGFAPQ